MGISEEQNKNCIRIIKELIFLPSFLLSLLLSPTAGLSPLTFSNCLSVFPTVSGREVNPGSLRLALGEDWQGEAIKTRSGFCGVSELHSILSSPSDRHENPWGHRYSGYSSE